MHHYIKSSLLFSAGAFMIGGYVAVVIPKNSESDLLLLGMALSMMLGIIVGVSALWGSKISSRGGKLKIPIMVCGASASIIMLLYFYLLGKFYHLGVFHLTLAVGLVSGCLFTLSYSYSNDRELTDPK